jgi:hypothetical protein
MSQWDETNEQESQSKLRKLRNRRVKATDDKKKIVGAVTGTVMAAGAILPMFAQTAQAAVIGTMSVDKNFAAVNELVTVTVNAPTFNTGSGTIETTAVSVSSSDDDRTLSITLTETGANTGIFQGTFKMVDPSAVSPATDEIKVQNNGTVNVLDPNWNTANTLNPIVVNVDRRDHETGVIRTFDHGTSAVISTLVHDGQAIRVELSDIDLNASSTIAEKPKVNVTTTAGVAGHELELTETGTNTGVFVGTFTVGTEVTPSNNDSIYIEYADAQKADNSSGTTTKTLIRRDFSAAALNVQTPNVTGKAAYDELITVRLTDADLNLNGAGAEAATVKITSADDAVGFLLSLTETGVDTGIFEGTFSMQDGATHAGARKIKVLNGNVVTVAYTDVRDEDGSTSPLTSTLTRKDHSTATISFDKTYAVIGEDVTTTVNDGDYINGTSNEQITVNVKSVTDTAGFNVTLTETGDTGIFTGVFSMIDGAVSDLGSVQLAVENDLETVTVSYEDAFQANNAVNVMVNGTMQRKDRMTGDFDFSRVTSAVGESLQFTLTDTDLDTNPGSAQTVNVTVTSAQDATGFIMSLTETGPNTGVFGGTIKPVSTPTNSNASPKEIQVNYDENVTISYSDSFKADGSAGNIIQTITRLRIPAISSITAAEAGANEVGAGAGDTVTIVFDTATNQPPIDAADIATKLVLDTGSWGTPANGLSAAWTFADTLVVTLGSDATVKKGAAITIAESAGIKNAAGTSASSVASSAINGTFGSQVPAIASITAAEAGASEIGAGADDTVTIVFDTLTNQPAIAAADVATKLVLSAGSWGTPGNGLSAAWTDSTTLVVTLGSDATVRKGANVTIDASAGIKDIGEESVASVSSLAIGGTFGSQTPAISSITAAEAGASEIGAGADDTVTIVFDTPTNQPAIAAADVATKLVLDAGSWGTPVNGLSAAWTDATTLVVTLGSDATVKKGATVTIDGSAGITDIGEESAATVSSLAIGGTFGSQTPAITSITAAEAGASEVGAGADDTVTIVFDTPTNQPAIAAADVASKLVLSAGSWGTPGNGLSAAWTDASTLVVTLGSDATVKKGATVTIDLSAGIKDIGEESAASVSSLAIDGTFGSQVPAIASITAAEAGAGEIGAGEDDTVTIVFDTPTNQSAIAAADIATKLVLNAGSWGTPGNGLSAAWTDANTLVVTLGSDATVKKGATVTIDVSAGIKDIGEESAASVSSLAIDGTFGSQVPAIASITAAEAGAGEIGAGEDDKVTIVFDTPTNQPAIAAADVASKLVLDAGSWGTAGNGLSATWTDSTTLVVTLGSDATVKKGATVTIDVSADIKDIGEESAATVSSLAIDGTFGSQVPAIASITAAEAGAGEIGAGEDDTVTIVFDTPTNQPAIAAADVASKLVLSAGSWGTAGNGLNAAWTDSTTLVVTLGSDATVKKGATVTIDVSAGIKDIGEESAASVSSLAIDGTFGSQVPAIASITAAEAGAGEIGAGEDDTVTIVFDTPTNQPAIAAADVASKLVLSAGGWGTAGNGLSAAWTDANTLVVTLGSDATVKKGATVTIDLSAGIKDIGEESAATVSSLVIDGTFGSQIPAIASITAAEAGAGEIGAGEDDTVTIVFDTPTNQPAIAAADVASKLVLSAGSWGTAGNGLSAAWTDATTLVVTLGSDATVKKGATVTIDVSAGIKDIGEESAASVSSLAIDGTFGSQTPVITSITAAEAGAGEIGAGAEDTVTIVFDTLTNEPAIAAADVATKLVLSAGSWGTPGNGLSAAWTDASTLVVTLGSDATVKKGAAVTIDLSAGITDIGEESAASTSSLAIGGTFGSQTPAITSITAAEAGAGEIGAGADDTVTIVFDTPTNQPAIAAGDVATKLVLSAGSWGTAGNGLSAAWTDSTTLVVTLGSDATVKKGATVTIDVSAGITDIGEESAASVSSLAIDGTFGSQVPAIASITAAEAGANEVGAGADDTVTIVFDTPTNQPAIAAADIATKLSLSAGSWGTPANGLNAAWTDATTLVVTLGSDATVKKGATLTIDLSAGITDIGEESPIMTGSASIGGTFGVGPVPAISSITAAEAGASEIGAGVDDTVTIVFNTPTNQPAIAAADIATKLVLSAGSWGTEGNGLSAAWTDASTLVVTLGSDATVKKSATVTIDVSAGIKDIGEESAASTSSLAIGGTFGSQVPAITSITAAEAGAGEIGAGADDTVTIVFDTPTNQPAIAAADVATKLVLGAGSWGTPGNGLSAAWTDASTLVVTLGSDATVKKGATVTVDLSAGITDIGKESAASTSSLAIDGTFGSQTPAISSITAAEAGAGEVGAGADDTVTIVFDTPTNQPAIAAADVATKLVLSAGSWGTAGNGLSAAWTDASTLVVTLGSDATAKKGAAVTIDLSAGITDIGEESAASTSSLAIGGTFGSQTPAITSITAAEAGAGEIGAGAGDTVTIVFDTPTNEPAIAAADVATKLVLSAGSWGTAGNGLSAAWTDATTLVVTLGTDATVKKGAAVTIDLSAGITDIGEESAASTSSLAIGGTFGSQTPAISSITAAEAGANEVGAGADDTVTIVFDTPTNQPAIAAADIATKLALSAGSWGTPGNGLSAAWTDASTLVVTLGSDATVKKGATVTIDLSAGITDIGEESAASTSSLAIGGTFGSQTPNITSITAAEAGASEVGAGADDTVTIVFDTPTNQPAIAAADIATKLVLSAGSWGTPGNGLIAAWTDASTLVVTLGSDATLKKGATVTIDGSAGITDIGEESAASVSSLAIGGTFGSQTPAISSITAAEAGAGEIGAGADDTVTIVFDTPTNQPAIAAADVSTKLVLSAGSWGTPVNGLSAAWTDATTLVVTLGSDATVKKGATVTIDGSAGITDIGEESAASTSSLAIGGTFGSQTPAISSITAAEAGANEVGAGADDTVTIVFDTPTNQPAIAAADIATKLALSAGSWGTPANGLNAAWTDATTLVVTLGSDATVKKDATLTIDLMAGITDIGEESPIMTGSASIGGSFGVGAVPAISSITAAEAGVGEIGAGADDTVTIVFNTPTNQPAIAAADIATKLVLDAGSWGTAGNGLSAAWADASTLVVTLGSDATVKKGATVAVDVSAGIKDVGEESAASTSSLAIGGTFGSQVPAITSVTAAEAGVGEIGAGADDTVTIVFDTPTNQPAIAAADVATKLVLGAGSWGTPGNGLSAAWTDASTLVVTLGSDATVKKGATVTVDLSAGITDIGEESAASTSSLAIDGTFGSQTPAISSITAAEAGVGEIGAGADDTVTIVFDTPTNQPAIAAADVATKLVLSAGSWGTAGNGLSVAWTDATTLVVTLGSDATVKKGAAVTIDLSAGITDIGEESAASTSSLTIGGTFGSQVPMISSITAANDGAQAGPNTGDTVTIVFDTPTNRPAIDPQTHLTTTGNWGTGATAVWTDVYTLVVTLGDDASVMKNDTVTLDASANLKDIGLESIVSTDNEAIGGTFGIGLVPNISIIQASNTGGNPGVEANDKVTISFTTATNKPSVNLNDITLDNSHVWGAGAAAVWNSDGTVLEITLGTGATVAIGDTVTITAAANITEISGESGAITGSTQVTGSFGAVIVPTVSNIVALNTGGNSSVEAGDQIDIIFSAKTNAPTIIDWNKLIVSNGHSFGASPAISWSADQMTLSITLGNGATITTADTITIDAGSGIQDYSGQVDVTVSNMIINGSFGVAIAPTLVNVYATNGDGQSTIGVGDTLVFVFDTPTNGVPVDLTKLVISNGHTLGATPTQAWSAGNRHLTVTLGAGATVTTADTVAIDTGSNITEASGQAALAATPAIAIGGSFGEAVAPIVTSITAVNGDGQPTVGAGDKIVIVFDSPTNGASVDLTKLQVSNGHTLGATPGQSWSSDNLRLTVTLDAGATITVGDTISIDAGSNIADANGQAALAATAAISVGGSFGVAVAPTVAAIQAVNTTGLPGTNPGDQILIVFDTPTNGGSVDLAKFTASGGHTLGAAPTYGWSEGNRHLAITLGAGATVTGGDTISIEAASGIMDATSGAALAAQANITIQGSFGVAVAPRVVAVTAVDGDGSALITDGDKLILVFDKEVNVDGFNVNQLLVNGLSGKLGDSATYELDTTKTVLTVTLGGSGIEVTPASTLTIAGGIVDAASGTLVLGNGGLLPATTGNFGAAIAPKVVSAVAVDQNGGPTVGGDKLVFTFDTPTNGYVPSTTVTKDLITVTNSTYGSIGNFAHFEWSNSNKVLTVTLSVYSNGGSNSSVTDSVYADLKVGDILDLTNLIDLRDATNTVPVDASHVTITGGFAPSLMPRLNYAVATSTGRSAAMNIWGTVELLFDTEMHQKPIDLNAIRVSNNHSFGSGASANWVSGTVLQITVMSDTTLQTGDEIDLSLLKLQDANRTAYLQGADAIKVLTGSFGTITRPSLIRIEIIDMNGSASTYNDRLVFKFSSPVDVTRFDPSKIEVSNGHTLGSTSTVSWNVPNYTELTIQLGADSTIASGDTISILAGNGIRDALGFFEIDPVTNMALTGSFGSTEAPSLLRIDAIDENGISSVAGDKLELTFNRAVNHNELDLSKIVVSNGHSLVIESHVWDTANKVLTIILGSGSTIQDGDKVSILAGNGIKDITGHSEMAPVVDKDITGTFGYGQVPAPKVLSVIGSSSIKKADSAISNGDIITITFDMPTNQSGNLNKAGVDQIVTFGSKLLGANYSGLWKENGRVLEITLIDVTGSNISIGDEIRVQGIKNALGTSSAIDQTNALSGIFDGRAFKIANHEMKSVGNRLMVKIQVEAIKGHTGNEAVAFQLSKGEQTIQIIATSVNIESNGEIIQYFDNLSDSLSDYKVKAMIWSNTNTTTGSDPLAQSIEMQLEN